MLQDLAAPSLKLPVKGKNRDFLAVVNSRPEKPVVPNFFVIACDKRVGASCGVRVATGETDGKYYNTNDRPLYELKKRVIRSGAVPVVDVIGDRGKRKRR